MIASHLETQTESVVAHAPAMIALSTKVGQPNEHGNAAILHLKLAVSRRDIATVDARADKEVFISFRDAYETPIDYPDIPQADMALVFRAIDELRNHLNRPRETSGLDVTIQKHIPFDTQLGGSSASAAAVLVAVAALWDATLTRQDLTRLAQRVAPGVADAMTGGAVITHHDVTEDLRTPLLVQRDIALVLVPAAADIENHEMLDTLRDLRAAQHPTEVPAQLGFETEFLEAVSHGDTDLLALMLHNDFQPALVSMLPEHHDWLTAGMDAGALATQTIGSGPSLVFLAPDTTAAEALADRFSTHMEIAAVAEYGPVAGAQLRSTR